mmetsp:Transcript_116933/g.330872  ORF Transcript_116933/g.330872 Transcript_116933/m.330872 type:complete len:126 (+) Transcript_116933:518-895(+)
MEKLYGTAAPQPTKAPTVPASLTLLHAWAGLQLHAERALTMHSQAQTQSQEQWHGPCLHCPAKPCTTPPPKGRDSEPPRVRGGAPNGNPPKSWQFVARSAEDSGAMISTSMRPPAPSRRGAGVGH